MQQENKIARASGLPLWRALDEDVRGMGTFVDESDIFVELLDEQYVCCGAQMVASIPMHRYPLPVTVEVVVPQRNIHESWSMRLL